MLLYTAVLLDLPGAIFLPDRVRGTGGGSCSPISTQSQRELSGAPRADGVAAKAVRKALLRGVSL